MVLFHSGGPWRPERCVNSVGDMSHITLQTPPPNQGPGCPVSTAPHAPPFGALRCCSLLSRTWVWFAFCDPEAHVWPTPPLPLFFLGSDIKAACFWKVLSLKVTKVRDKDKTFKTDVRQGKSEGKEKRGSQQKKGLMGFLDSLSCYYIQNR